MALLERVEALYRSRSDAGEDYRLSDDFDLIGGTSTGSIIASGLALSYRLSDLLDAYTTLANDAFSGARTLGGVSRSRVPISTFAEDHQPIPW